MRKLLLLNIMLLLPSVAFAHDGHGGVGLFHHFLELVPVLGLLAVVAAGVIWVKKRK
ncbi:hypothetical protein ACVBIL_01525 [Shewanella sp. 125m-7]